MGILNSFFGGKKEQVIESNVNWIPLTSLNHLEEIKELSKTRSVLIFKHSTRCGISCMVIKRFEKLFNETMNKIPVYYLDLLNYKDISDEVGYKFQVMHQSPQLLIIKDGTTVFHTSHYDITAVNINNFV